MNNLTSVSDQKERCLEIHKLTTEYNLKKFTEQGEWTGEKFSLGLREKLYFCIAFLNSGREDAICMANIIITRLNYYHCHFSPMISLQLLLKYSGLLEDAAREGLSNYAEKSLDGCMGPDLDFVGVNDNFPSMGTFVCLVGGDMFSRPDVYQKGVEKLKQFKKLLIRRGVASEYNSSTYSAVQLIAIAEIANWVKDEEIRKLARQCEERLWADVLGHLHRETCQVAGPYSRAYTVDSTGHTHQTRDLYYALLGDKLPVNLRNTIFSSEKRQEGAVIHHSVPFHQISAAWFLDTVYECPEYLIDLALNKKYPYEFIATTEFSSSTDATTVEPERDPYKEDETFEYPSGCGRISTYMTENYALGVATHEFHNGVQTDAFHVLYRRKTPVTVQKDINTVYARYIINEKTPAFTIGSFEDMGRKLGIQDKNSALMLYKPKISYRHNVSSLKLSIMIPISYGMVEEIWLGERKVKVSGINIMGESNEACSVYIKDGPVYMAFHPVILTDYGRKAAVRLENTGEYLLISFYNYEGEARDFAARGFLLTGNGFAAEIRSENEVDGFEAFRKQAAEYEIKDVLQASVHSRQTFIRKTDYIRKGLSLECEYSPVSEGIKYIAVNTRELAQPKLYISGFETNRLPFINKM